MHCLTRALFCIAVNIGDVEDLVLSQDSDPDYKLVFFFAEGRHYEHEL